MEIVKDLVFFAAPGRPRARRWPWSCPQSRPYSLPPLDGSGIEFGWFLVGFQMKVHPEIPLKEYLLWRKPGFTGQQFNLEHIQKTPHILPNSYTSHVPSVLWNWWKWKSFNNNNTGQTESVTLNVSPTWTNSFELIFFVFEVLLRLQELWKPWGKHCEDLQWKSQATWVKFNRKKHIRNFLILTMGTKNKRAISVKWTSVT